MNVTKVTRPALILLVWVLYLAAVLSPAVAMLYVSWSESHR